MTSAATSADNLALIVTADCNLRCHYCYQNAKQPRAMSWSVLRAALDALLAPPPRLRTVWFSGGEPTLAWPSIERAVGYVDERLGAPPEQTLVYRITTNGLLLGPARLAYLAAREFRVTLSMDGVASSQDLRGRGTFTRLDCLLQRWRDEHFDHFRRCCRVSVTLTREAIPHFADSVEHLLARRVPDIVIDAARGDGGWNRGDLERLDRQLARVEAASVEHLSRTGEIPVSAFRKEPRAGRRTSGDRHWPCGAPSGRTLTVDVDGLVYPCVLAARSYQRFADPEIDRRMACLALGDIREGATALNAPQAAEVSGLFDSTQLQHAGRRLCASCRARADCLICPIARVCHGPAEKPNGVPEYLCAFNRLLWKHAGRFRRNAGLDGVDDLLTALLSSLNPGPRAAPRRSRQRTVRPSPRR